MKANAQGPERERASASLELLYQISRELSSRLELPSLLEHILQITTESVGAVNGSILALDQNGGVMEGALIYNGMQVPGTAQQLSATLERGLAGWVIRHRQGALVPDTEADERWLKRPDDEESSGPKSAVSVPLLVRDRVVGVLTLVHPTPGYFGQSDLDLASAIADQAGLAIENARLFSESQRQVQVMGTLAETSRAITATLELDEVLRQILTRTRHDLGVEAASIALMDADSGLLEFKLAEGPVMDGVIGLKLKPGEGIAGWVAEHGQPVIVPEVKKDPRFDSDVDRQTGFVTRSIACVPILVKSRTLGVLEVINPIRGAFDENSLTILSGIAGLASTAILHAQLFAETQAAERRYAGLFEDSIDSILITDLSGTITNANRRASEFLGYPPGELIGLRVDTVHRVDTSMLGKKRFRGLPSGRPHTFETTATARDGRILPVEVHVKRIERSGQEFVQWIEHDIAERAALEEMRNDLMAMIYHDLRSPLGNIISSLDVLGTALASGDDTQRAVLGIARRASQRLTRLVDSLLDVHRLESGKATLHKEQVSVKSLVAEAAEAVRPGAADRGLQLDIAPLPYPPPVNVDVEMIRRVLTNLLENAVKYTPAGGSIAISAEANQTELFVTVSNTGPGIPIEQQAILFEKFARAQREGGPRGLGLGLAFCRLAVQAHGGRIWVESEPGLGAKFTFTLPL